MHRYWRRSDDNFSESRHGGYSQSSEMDARLLNSRLTVAVGCPLPTHCLLPVVHPAPTQLSESSNTFLLPYPYVLQVSPNRCFLNSFGAQVVMVSSLALCIVCKSDILVTIEKESMVADDPRPRMIIMFRTRVTQHRHADGSICLSAEGRRNLHPFPFSLALV